MTIRGGYKEEVGRCVEGQKTRAVLWTGAMAREGRHVAASQAR